jgi:CubicO group peptidase (beta-lactamase class C family)
MFIPRRTTALTLLLLTATALGTVEAQTPPPPLADFDAYAAQAVEDWEAVGLAVAVVKDGELVFAEGYGVRDLEAGGAVGPDTRFSIGSTTKAMTAAALGMLVDEGKLEWDDPVIDHLPRFRLSDPWLTREVTIRDLLTHRAGLGNADHLWYEVETDRDEILSRFAHTPVAYSPRSSFIYQNIMYAAAGSVVEAVSGTPWPDFVTRRIFEPLGMNGTRALLSRVEGEPDVARPHDRVNGERVPIQNASVDPVDAAGSVWSSVADMSIWLRFLLAGGVAPDGERLLEEATVDELFRPQTLIPLSQFYPTTRLTEPDWTSYGLGWFQHDYRGHKLDFHTGSIDGMVAIAGLVRDEDLGVYVLGNLDHVEVRHALLYRVLDLYLAPDDVRDWSVELKELYDGLAEGARAQMAAAEEARVEGTSPSHDLSAYVGRYGADGFEPVEVSLSGSQLEIYRGPGLQGPLTHWHFDTFRAEWEAAWRGTAAVAFETGADGTVVALRSGGVRMERLPEAGGT